MQRVLLVLLFVLPGALSAEVEFGEFEALPTGPTPTLFETSGFLENLDLDELAKGYASATSKEWGNYSVGGALGFTVDPSAFLTVFEFDIWVMPQFSFGPISQFALSRTVIFTTTVSAKGYLDIDEWAWTEFAKLYAHLGLGWELISEPRRTGSGFGLLVSGGIGVDIYPFKTEQVSLTAGIILNWSPTKPKGRPFFASFALAGARFHF